MLLSLLLFWIFETRASDRPSPADLNTCVLVDDYQCLRDSPGWGGNWDCEQAKSKDYCAHWPKDTWRCCPNTCGHGKFTKYHCDHIYDWGKGTCQYPNGQEDNCRVQCPEDHPYAYTPGSIEGWRKVGSIGSHCCRTAWSTDGKYSKDVSKRKTCQNNDFVKCPDGPRRGCSDNPTKVECPAKYPYAFGKGGGVDGYNCCDIPFDSLGNKFDKDVKKRNDCHGEWVWCGGMNGCKDSSIPRPYCTRVNIVDMKTIGEMQRGQGTPQITYIVNQDVNRCRQNTEAVITQHIAHTYTQTHTDTYTVSKSWAQTFSHSSALSLSIGFEGAFEFVKVSSKVETKDTTEVKKTSSSSDTTTQVATEIATTSSTTDIQITVPPFHWFHEMMTYERYEIQQGFTATAICHGENGKILEKAPIRGTWGGAYLSEIKVPDPIDKTHECPTAQKCICAGLDGSWLGGAQCTKNATRGDWCYVRIESPCQNKMQLDRDDMLGMSEYHKGLSQTNFMWSRDPCKQEKPKAPTWCRDGGFCDEHKAGTKFLAQLDLNTKMRLKWDPEFYCRAFCHDYPGCDYYSFSGTYCMIYSGTCTSLTKRDYQTCPRNPPTSNPTRSPTMSPTAPAPTARKYTETAGWCRGGTLKWEGSRDAWKCGPASGARWKMTQEQCGAQCDATDGCFAFDQPSGSGPQECCLFRQGYTGNSKHGRSCFVARSGDDSYGGGGGGGPGAYVPGDYVGGGGAGPGDYGSPNDLPVTLEMLALASMDLEEQPAEKRGRQTHTVETVQHYLTLAALPPVVAAEELKCTTLPGYSLSAPGEMLRIIVDGECGTWTCMDDGSFDIAQCTLMSRQSRDCIVGGQVVKSSENLPLIYGTDGCITAACRNGELRYSQCGSHIPTSPTCGDGMQHGDSKRVIDVNGICIEAECEANGIMVYTSCVPSNDECILPNYNALSDGKSTEVYDEKGMCSEFICNNGILDVHSCAVVAPPSNSTGEHVEGSLAAPLEQVGRLMDRLGNYLTHQGFRR